MFSIYQNCNQLQFRSGLVCPLSQNLVIPVQTPAKERIIVGVFSSKIQKVLDILMRPTVTRPVQDPLAVPLRDNQLYIHCIYFSSKIKSLSEPTITRKSGIQMVIAINDDNGIQLL